MFYVMVLGHREGTRAAPAPEHPRPPTPRRSRGALLDGCLIEEHRLVKSAPSSPAAQLPAYPHHMTAHQTAPQSHRAAL